MEDFVTYDVAIKLKEKGFNWICSHYYRTKCKDLFMVFPCEDWSYIEDRVNAPTISQVLKWLREDKGIHICIIYSITPFANWEYEIVEIDGVIYANADDGYDTYKEATLAGIKYTIDNLI